MAPWLEDLRQVFAPQWYGNCMPRLPGSGALPPGTALTEQQRTEVVRLISTDYLPARLAQLEALVGSSAGLGAGGDGSGGAGGVSGDAGLAAAAPAAAGAIAADGAMGGASTAAKGAGVDFAVAAEAAGAGNPGPFVCGKDISIADLSLYVLLEGLTDPTVAYCPGVAGLQGARQPPPTHHRVTVLLTHRLDRRLDPTPHPRTNHPIPYHTIQYPGF